jgi:hypothetical protein
LEPVSCPASILLELFLLVVPLVVAGRWFFPRPLVMCLGSGPSDHAECAPHLLELFVTE